MPLVALKVYETYCYHPGACGSIRGRFDVGDCCVALTVVGENGAHRGERRGCH